MCARWGSGTRCGRRDRRVDARGPGAAGGPRGPELAAYERENREWPPRHPELPGYRYGFDVVVLSVLVLVALTIASEQAAFGFDWFAAGRIDSDLVRAGQWWRSLTALTLHVGIGHLIGKHPAGIAAHAHCEPTARRRAGVFRHRGGRRDRQYGQRLRSALGASGGGGFDCRVRRTGPDRRDQLAPPSRPRHALGGALVSARRRRIRVGVHGQRRPSDRRAVSPHRVRRRGWRLAGISAASRRGAGPPARPVALGLAALGAMARRGRSRWRRTDASVQSAPPSGVCSLRG